MMRTQRFLLGTTSAYALFGAFFTSPAQALVIEQNVNFAAVNRNPWTGGGAFESEWHLNQPSVGPFKIDLPKLNGNPINVLADFLGVNLPFSANVGVGGSISGFAGFDFGYYVSGGKLNVNYPTLSKLDIQTTPNTNRVVAGQSFGVTTQYTPGLNVVSPPLNAYVAAAGAGYEVLHSNLNLGTTTKDAFLKTTFPYASAWANFNYDLKGGAFVEATAKILGECIVCARKDVKFGDARDLTLIEIDPGGKGQPPVVRFLGNSVNPLAPIQIGPAKIEFSYPDVAVQGGLQPDKSLFGAGSKPIISVQGGVEKLVPFIGPFLTNGVGPFGYQLLSTDGGPTLGLYQDFQFTPDLRGQLAFSQPILQKVGNKYVPTNVVDFKVGEALDLVAPMTLFGSTMRVQPSYTLNNTVRNETGLSLGVQFDIEALKLTSAFGSLGPAIDERLTYELGRVPLFNQTFSLGLKEITTRPFELDVVPSLATVFGPKMVLLALDYNDGSFEFELTLRDLATGLIYHKGVDGDELEFGEGSFAQKILVTDGDVTLEDVLLGGFDGEFYVDVNLGDTFCFVCIDMSALLFEEENPSITQDDQTLFLTDLFEFPSGEMDITNHPILGTNNFKDDHRPVATDIGPTVFLVPEPGALALFAGGLVALRLGRRRRGRA
jgi:hypothetical protein